MINIEIIFARIKMKRFFCRYGDLNSEMDQETDDAFTDLTEFNSIFTYFDYVFLTLIFH